MSGENNSTKKIAIEFVAKPDGTHWIDVLLLKYGARPPRFRPSFRDLHRIIQAIAQCEDEAYPPPVFAGRGRLAAFLRDAAYECNYEVLARKYQIPERAGDAVVTANGADLLRKARRLEPNSDVAIDLEIAAQDAARERRGQQ